MHKADLTAFRSDLGISCIRLVYLATDLSKSDPIPTDTLLREGWAPSSRDRATSPLSQPWWASEARPPGAADLACPRPPRGAQLPSLKTTALHACVPASSLGAGSAGMGRWAAASDEGGVVRASLGLGGSPGDGARGGASQRRGATGPWPPGGRPHPRDAAGRPRRRASPSTTPQALRSLSTPHRAVPHLASITRTI